MGNYSTNKLNVCLMLMLLGFVLLGYTLANGQGIFVPFANGTFSNGTFIVPLTDGSSGVALNGTFTDSHNNSSINNSNVNVITCGSGTAVETTTLALSGAADADGAALLHKTPIGVFNSITGFDEWRQDFQLTTAQNFTPVGGLWAAATAPTACVSEVADNHILRFYVDSTNKLYIQLRYQTGVGAACSNQFWTGTAWQATSASVATLVLGTRYRIIVQTFNSFTDNMMWNVVLENSSGTELTSTSIYNYSNLCDNGGANYYWYAGGIFDNNYKPDTIVHYTEYPILFDTTSPTVTTGCITTNMSDVTGFVSNESCSSTVGWKFDDECTGSYSTEYTASGLSTAIAAADPTKAAFQGIFNSTSVSQCTIWPAMINGTISGGGSGNNGNQVF